jgi:mannose-1-phosphate guanylyltransferase
VVRPESAFAELIPWAASIALREDLLFTVAAVPDRPETGYGYIRPGATILKEGELDAFRVGAFVEKPDAPTAERYLGEGCLWNTGIFILPVRRFLQEIRMHAPEIGRHLDLLDRGDEVGFFEAVPTISVDEAVLERSERVGAARATFEWDDVGSWEALGRTREPDANGNLMEGEVYAVDSNRTVAWAEDGPIVLFGVEDLVVVRSGNVTLVASRERAPDLKALVSQLPPRLQDPTPPKGPKRSAEAGNVTKGARS